jgi:hypothetical protein
LKLNYILKDKTENEIYGLISYILDDYFKHPSVLSFHLKYTTILKYYNKSHKLDIKFTDIRHIEGYLEITEEYFNNKGEI